MKTKLKIIVGTVMVAALFLPSMAMSMQTGTAPAKTVDKGKSAVSRKTEAMPPPSDRDIADAKSKGLVWVNLGTRVYHKDGEFYGKTKRGKFMNEDEAKKAGFHEAKQPGTSKKASGSTPQNKKQGDQSGTDATEATHSSTPRKP
jgi:hypothetical protein